MYQEVIEKILKMNYDDEFYFTVCNINDNRIEYAVGVKYIFEFDSILVLVGASGGGFNMVFIANDNMINREACIREEMTEEFPKCFIGYKFVGFENEN